LFFFLQTSSITKDRLPILQSVTIGNKETKIEAEAGYKRRAVAYHLSTEVMNSSSKSHSL